MNDLVKDLLKKSTYEILGVPQVDQKKFAELIVKECIGIIHQQERVPKEFFFAKSALQHELAIKEHFGVNND